MLQNFHVILHNVLCQFLGISILLKSDPSELISRNSQPIGKKHCRE